MNISTDKAGKIKETLTCHSLALNSTYELFPFVEIICHMIRVTYYMYNLEEIPGQTRTQQKVHPSKMTWECPPVQLEEE